MVNLSKLTFLEICPRCQSLLQQAHLKDAVLSLCPQQCFVWISTTALAILTDYKLVESLQAYIATKSTGTPVACPSCKRNLSRFTLTKGSHTIEAEFCPPCSHFLLSPVELQQTLGATHALPILTNRQVESNLQAARQGIDDPVAYVFGLLSKRGAPSSQSLPVVCTLLIASTLFFVIHDQSSANRLAPYVFMPHKTRFISWLSAGFIHLGYLHWIRNSIALYIFGESVEEESGALTLLCLFLASIFGGHLAFVIMNGWGPSALMGASGGVFGVMSYFCIRYQQAEIGIPLTLLRWNPGLNGNTRRSETFWLPALAYVIGLLLMELFLQKHNPNSATAHAAHLGGAVVGGLWALVMPKK